ncbi:2Fe-2S iron-sulfur cluster-binding protein [Scandinavium manionii]|uniref:2Fe-2S iron-sulfur cluster-binding protein n=1 Tax=Scandinavium manionii TaxID=2926520 RepID=UPI00190F544D|nr:2Fe-2S iron-sulfur cluster-binding protein [Scandinavium manionii]MCS2148437.1 (2Fe-2S)-binding protein [Scandinavium manionii]
MMNTIIYKLASGQEMRASAGAGVSLMQAAIQHGVPGVVGECGGSASCGTCHLYIEQGGDGFPAPDEMELGMLEFTAAALKAESRLGCQCILQEEMPLIIVQVPDTQV